MSSTHFKHNIGQEVKIMQLSTIIGKQILSPSGELLGYVKNAYLNRTLSKLMMFVCIDDDEEEFFLASSSVVSIGDVMIAQKSRVSLPAGLVVCPIGKPAYSHLGQELGVVCDYLFDEGTHPVFILVKDGIQSPQPANKLSVGEKVIVYPNEKLRKPSIVTKKARSGNLDTIKKPELMEEEKPLNLSLNQPKQEEKPVSQKTEKTVESLPDVERISTNVNRFNLLGKQVKRPVYNNQGFPIIAAGQVITAEILNHARRNNRLLELTVNTLTNIW